MQEAPSNEKKNNILLFFSSGLGDMLFLAPTYLALRDLYPAAHITAVVPQLGFNKFLLQDIFKFDSVLSLDRLRSFSPHAIISYIKHFYSLVKTVRKQKFDMVFPTVEICLPDQYLLTFLSGAKTRIGPKYLRRQKNKFRFLLTKQVESPFDGHIIDLHFNLVRSLQNNLEINTYFKKTTDLLVRSATPSNFRPITNKLFIVVPGSGGQPYKRWPFQHYVEVISNILNGYECDVVILSGAQEYDGNLIPSDISGNPRFHNLSDSLALSQIIHLFLQANLVLGNDNGLLHLAEFLNIPTIGIYPGNWMHVSKRFFDNDAKHIVLPKNTKDILSEYLMDNVRRNQKIQNVCKDVVNSVSTNDVVTEIEHTSLLK
jgi:ADP-heptose:LPS heptosyltransferase